MAKRSVGALAAAPRTRTALALESLALRHQILVLKRSETRRPCFRLIDRLFWVLLSRWWPQWRESLTIVQPQTVLRWAETVGEGSGGIAHAVAGEAGVHRSAWKSVS